MGFLGFEQKAAPISKKLSFVSSAILVLTISKGTEFILMISFRLKNICAIFTALSFMSFPPAV